MRQAASQAGASKGHDVGRDSVLPCYLVALGDFGHSYIVDKVFPTTHTSVDDLSSRVIDGASWHPTTGGWPLTTSAWQHQQSRSCIAQQGIGAEYVAPEVEEGSASSKASDVYGAGKILEHFLNQSCSFKDEIGRQPQSLVRIPCSTAAQDVTHARCGRRDAWMS